MINNIASCLIQQTDEPNMNNLKLCQIQIWILIFSQFGQIPDILCLIVVVKLNEDRLPEVNDTDIDNFPQKLNDKYFFARKQDIYN